jgi:hypothetical protein
MLLGCTLEKNQGDKNEKAAFVIGGRGYGFDILQRSGTN